MKVFVNLSLLFFFNFHLIWTDEDPQINECDFQILADEILELENNEENDDIVADRNRNEQRDRDQRNLYETNRDALRREARERALKNRYNRPEGQPPNRK